MMGLIHVDYDNARRQAQRLDQAADNCGTVIRALEQEAANLPANWAGAAADACMTALENRIRDLKVLQQETEQTAAAIRQVADAFVEQERQLRAAMEAGPSASSDSGEGRGGGW